MKKTYIQPAIMLVKSDTESNILAMSGNTLSDTFSDTVDTEKVYQTGDVLSKYNKTSGLWDTSWNTDDEDDE
mgnify:CR=1 FL=1